MQCIGVDVGKQTMVTYDGEKEQEFPNREGLPEFVEFVNHGRKVLAVFETTSTYSHKLEALCREKNILMAKLDPRLTPSLRVVQNKRSKTDQTDAELLYRYGVERPTESVCSVGFYARRSGVPLPRRVGSTRWN